MKAACGSMRDGKIPSHLRLLLPVANKSGPWIMRARKLALPLTTCITQESRLCTIPWQHKRWSYVCVCVGGGCTQVSQPLGNENRRADLVLPLHMSPSAIWRQGSAFPLVKTVELALVVWVWVTLNWGQESRRAGPTPSFRLPWVN